MTYKQAYDKIIDAYFNDEIKPLNSSFCFCGTLCGTNHNWGIYCPKDEIPNKEYSKKQYLKMEDALFEGMYKIFTDGQILNRENNPLWEDALFIGMSDALEVLKQIHIDRGEVIDSLPTFTKRVFSDVLKMVK